MIDDVFDYIGVDPGLSGAVAIIRTAKAPLAPLVQATAFPIAGNQIDMKALLDWLDTRIHSPAQSLVCIEKVSAMPGQGVTSMFTFGFNTGLIHGLFSALEIPRHIVTPQAWKKIILEGTKKDKDAAIDFCRRIYPNVSLMAGPRSKKPHTGIADALCIARYAMLKCR